MRLRHGVIQKRINAMIDAAVHEIKIDWPTDDRFPHMTREEQDVAIAAALGGLVLVIQDSFNGEQERLARRMALQIHSEITRGGGVSAIVDRNGVPFKVTRRSVEDAS